MQTTIRQFQAEVRDILNNDPWFANHGIVWRAEDTLDIEFQIKDAISRTGLAAVVVTPNLTYQGEAATTTSRKNYEEIPGGWRTQDEQGREITVLTAEDNQVTVSGGCFGSHSMIVTIGEETTEIVGDKTYKATVTFDGDIPKTVSLSVTKDNLSGAPFDKKLIWIDVEGNAFFNTSVVPDINDFWASDFCPIGRHSTNEYITLCGTSNNRTANDQFGVFHGSAVVALNNRRGNYQYNCPIGFFIDADGVSSQTSTMLNEWEHLGAFGGLQFASTAATGSRAWRFGFQAKSPDTWSANQAATGGNANPTYTNTTIPLAILGVHNGDESNKCYNWHGKFWSFRMWDRLRTTKKLDLYPVLKDGNVCLYNVVSNTVIQNGYTGDTSTITWKEDADFNEIINDNSTVDFVETVKVVDKGFDTEVSLQLIENPTVNRGKPDKDQIATALDAAHHAVYTLAGYDSGNFNNFNASTIRQTTVGAAQNKLLQVEAKLNSTVIL